MLNIYANEYAQEKVYLQLDRQIYRPGETIWFKAYLFSGAEPSAMSHNFYAELSDSSGAILQRKTYPVVQSSAVGSFDLPLEIDGVHLHIRAYTTWMTNFDTAFYFERDIRIDQGKPDPMSPITTAPGESWLQFFPEGGDIVSGVETMVAFRATDWLGRPVMVDGLIESRDGKQVAGFRTEHDGMGKFLLPADAGDSLAAVWKDEQGAVQQTTLPAARATGAVLRAVPGNRRIYFSVTRPVEARPALQRFLIIGHMHQHPVYQATIDLRDHTGSGGTIPTDNLPSGVLVLTVFGEDMTPLAERAVFVNNHDYQNHPALSIQTSGVARRGKNTIVIDVPDTIVSNMSLSVTDAAVDGHVANQDNIVSRLLLTGEVRGYVHDPYFYFSDNSDSLAQLLDLVMMTHGWRKIDWLALEKGQPPLIRNKDPAYLALEAYVSGVNSKKIAKKESLNVVLTGRDSAREIVQVPHLGGSRFGTEGLIFYDTVTAVYRFNSDHGLDYKAKAVFNTGLVPGARAARALASGFDGGVDGNMEYLAGSKSFRVREPSHLDSGNLTAKMMAAVIVRAKEKTPMETMDDRYARGIFAGGMAYQFDLADDVSALSFTSVFQYLQGKVPGLLVQFNPRNGWSLRWRGDAPQIFVDEEPVTTDVAGNMSISDVAYVKAFRPGTEVGFSTGFGGSIAIYTKKGNDVLIGDSRFAGLTAKLAGYAIPRQFYSPDYEKDPQIPREDRRPTLLWKPYLWTGKDRQHISIDFFNNDVSTKLRVVLEGFDENGKLTHIERIISF